MLLQVLAGWRVTSVYGLLQLVVGNSPDVLIVNTGRLKLDNEGVCANVFTCVLLSLLEIKVSCDG